MTTNETTNRPELTEEELSKYANAELRAYKDRLEEEVGTLRDRVIGIELAAIGLNTGEGLGKAIAKEYKGDLDGKSLAEFAKVEYGHSLAEPPVESHIITEGQERLEKVMGGAEPVTPEQEVDEVAQREAKLAESDASRIDAQHSMEAKLAAFNTTFNN